MTRLASLLTSLLPLTLVIALPARAAPVLIKLGTIAPKDSRYDQVLEEMGQKWAEASGGQVKLRVYAGGVAGGEADMVRKIGVGQLQAAAITTVGMHDISSEPQALNIPMMVKTPAELDYVLSKVRPRLDAALAKKGFVVMSWASAGAPRLFSTIPLRTPADLDQVKIWAWDGDPAAAESFKIAGFHPVVLSSTDIVPSLETGLINTVPEPPLFVFVTRTFEKANHMLDVPWGMLTGATVVRKETWDKIAPDVQQKMLAIADDTGKLLSAEIQHLDENAIEQMKKQGLQVTHGDEGAWQAVTEKAWPNVRGKVVPADLFDEVRRLLKEYRASHGQ
jgi:TRAP-type C4-dicarboxylate transport system substrate-binding protein